MSLRWLRAKTALAHAFYTALALVWLPCTRVQAEPELALEWRSAVGCPDAAWATQRIAAQLGRDLSPVAKTELRAHVEIAREGERFRLTLRTIHGETTGERTIDDAGCEQLAEAATLMIALAIDAEAVLEAQAAADGSAPTAPPTAPPSAPPIADASERRGVTNERTPPSPTRAPEKRRGGYEGAFRARMSVIGDAGFLPRPSVGPELAFGIHRERLGLEGSGFWLPERRSKGAPRVAVSVWALTLRGCVHRTSRRWLVGGCLGAELGRISADGMGLRENLEKRAVFAAMQALARARLRLTTHVWLATDLGLSVPFYRPRFVSQDTRDQSQTVLHTPQPLTARASVGIEFTF